MKISRSLLLALALVALFAGCKKARYEDPLWNVGDWAEYEVKGGSLESYRLRYAITGVDTVEGEPYYWFEMIGSSGESRFAYKMLVPYGYRGVAERMIIKVGDQPALEMPKFEGLNEEPPGENRPYLYLAAEVDSAKIGEEKITVPAGDFKTIHAKIKDSKGQESEIWVCAEVPVFGIVAAESFVEEMKLVAKGNDAKTAITEEPHKIDETIFEHGR
jgi:hypothetical protein